MLKFVYNTCGVTIL